MASNKRSRGSLTDIPDGPETHGSFKPSRLVPSNSDSALVKHDSSQNSEDRKEFSGCERDWLEQGYFTSPSSTDQTDEEHCISQYTNCRATSGVTQINGIVMECGPDEVDGMQPPKGSYHYTGCSKVGKGAQVNGVEVVVCYAVEHKLPRLPGMNGEWRDLVMESGGVDGTMNQINGGRVRMLRDDEGTIAPRMIKLP